MIFREGWIKFRSVGYYIFNIAFDYFMTLCAAIFMFVVVYVACSLLPTRSSYDKNGEELTKKEKMK
jgi:hypothetical protein